VSARRARILGRGVARKKSLQACIQDGVFAVR